MYNIINQRLKSHIKFKFIKNHYQIIFCDNFKVYIRLLTLSYGYYFFLFLMHIQWYFVMGRIKGYEWFTLFQLCVLTVGKYSQPRLMCFGCYLYRFVFIRLSLETGTVQRLNGRPTDSDYPGKRKYFFVLNYCINSTVIFILFFSKIQLSTPGKF